MTCMHCTVTCFYGILLIIMAESAIKYQPQHIAIAYSDTGISGMKRATITILAPSGSSSQMLIQTKSKATVLNYIRARDKM